MARDDFECPYPERKDKLGLQLSVLKQEIGVIAMAENTASDEAGDESLSAFDWNDLEARLRELAFLNKGLITKLIEERTGRETTFHYPRGVAKFVEYLNHATEVLHKPFSMDQTIDGVKVEIAIQYTPGAEEEVYCYTNNTYNAVGGTHLSGFRAALTRALSAYGRKMNLFKSGVAPIGGRLPRRDDSSCQHPAPGATVRVAEQAPPEQPRS